VQVTRLRLENWRNFTSVDALLTPRVFLVGPNASGKSNLLDAVRFLRDIVAVGGGFRSAVDDRRGGVSRIRCLAARRNPDVVLDVSIGNTSSEATARWRYRIAFSQDNNKRPVLREEKVWKGDDLVLSRPTRDDDADPERLRQTALEQITANREFRPIAEFFTSVRYLHIVPQLVREPDRSAGRRDDPFGGDFLERMTKVPANTRNSRLRRIAEALKIAVPQLRELELWKDERGVPHLRGLHEHWRPNAGWQTEEQLSDGTLRLLGLLWSVLDGTGPLLLEEPELSLHSEVIRYIPEMFARIQRKRTRQIIVSTHSAELLHHPGIGGDEVLMLIPSPEGTRVEAASGDREVRALLDGGATVAEAVIPRTQPKSARQLALFP